MEDVEMNETVVDEPQPVQQEQKKHAVERKPLKKEAPLAPRLASKLKELEARGLLNGAKAHLCPQEAAKLAKDGST